MLARVTTINAGLKAVEPTEEEMEALKTKYIDVTMPACPNTVDSGCCREDVKPFVMRKPTPQERWMASEGHVVLNPPYSTKKFGYHCTNCDTDFDPPPPAPRRALDVALSTVWTKGKMPNCPECNFFQNVVRVVVGKPPFWAPLSVFPSLIKLAHRKEVKLADYHPAVDKGTGKRLTHYCRKCKHYWHESRGLARLDPQQVYPGALMDVRGHYDPAFESPAKQMPATGFMKVRGVLPASPFVGSFDEHPYDHARRAPTPPPSVDSLAPPP